MTLAAAAVVLVAAIALASWLIGIYNHLVFLRNQAARAWYNIDVLLKQRHDEVPKLVAVCEASAKFERETLDRVISARQSAVAAPSVAARARAEGELSSAVGRLLAVSESYPELKTVALFGQLQARLSSLESEIADRREFFNDAATNFNTRIETLPDALLASRVGMKPRDLFKVAAADTADVEVKFGI